jgi:hypothetical protein
MQTRRRRCLAAQASLSRRADSHGPKVGVKRHSIKWKLKEGPLNLKRAWPLALVS